MNVSLKDLIKIATDKTNDHVTQDSSRYLDEIHRFILTLKIKEGKNKVQNRLIYKVYKMWALKPMQTHAFYFLFGKYFPQKRMRHRFYLLNYKPIQLLNLVDNQKIRIKK